MLYQLYDGMSINLLAEARISYEEWSNSLEVAKVILIQLGDETAGTARLAKLYVALEGIKFPAAFCRFAV